MQGYAATTNFSITLASLASGSSRESTTITASVGGTSYDDFMLQMSFGLIGSSSPSGDKMVYVWFAGSADGTNFTEPATGSDAAITIGTNHNLRGPFPVMINAGSVIYDVCIPSVRYYFDGNIPIKFNMIVENQTGAALNGTESNFKKWITPVFQTT